MQNDGSAISKKGLNLIQRGGSQRLKKPQPEALRNRGVNSVEDSVCAGALDPGGPAIRIKKTACFSELQTRPAFGTFEPS